MKNGMRKINSFHNVVITMQEEQKEDLRKYGGKWVALCGKKIIASGDSLKEVMEKAKKVCEKPEVFQVPKEDETYILNSEHPLKFEYEELHGKFYPIVPVEVKSNNKIIKTKAFIDSGATISTFNSQIADYLEIDYKKGEKIFPLGISGHICAYLNDIVIVLQGEEIACKVLFSDEMATKFNLLGRSGLFEKFRICFDDKEKAVSLFKN